MVQLIFGGIVQLHPLMCVVSIELFPCIYIWITDIMERWIEKANLEKDMRLVRQVHDDVNSHREN
jgi:hypothetical protein